MPLTVESDVLAWDARQGVLLARRERRVGELVLGSKPLNSVPAAAKTSVLCEVVRSEGLSLLNWTAAARQWQARAQSLHLWRGGEWPDLSDAHLLGTLEQWLAPWLDKVNRRDDFARLQVLDMLHGLLTHKQHTQLEELAPTHLEVPSGSHIRLEYSADGSAPVLAVKLQEMFGLADTPTVNDGRSRLRSGRSKSRRTCAASGPTPTRPCAKSCAAATTGTPGPKTPGTPRRHGGPCGGESSQSSEQQSTAW
jgi:ATP-dependent helicase HrpB